MSKIKTKKNVCFNPSSISGDIDLLGIKKCSDIPFWVIPENLSIIPLTFRI